MYKNVAVAHPEYGIFVGVALGLAFWSKFDAVGQNSVAVFETVDQAKELLSKIEVPMSIKQFRFVEIETDNEFYATIKELKEVGLGDLLGHLGTGENSIGMAIKEDEPDGAFKI